MMEKNRNTKKTVIHLRIIRNKLYSIISKNRCQVLFLIELFPLVNAIEKYGFFLYLFICYKVKFRGKLSQQTISEVLIEKLSDLFDPCFYLSETFLKLRSKSCFFYNFFETDKKVPSVIITLNDFLFHMLVSINRTRSHG
jgi:hypothetical protein